MHFFHLLLFQMHGLPFKPITLHGLSFSFHLLLFLTISIAYLFKSSNLDTNSNPKHGLRRTIYKKPTILASLVVGLFDFCLSVHYYFWVVHGFWSSDGVVTLLDLGMRGFVWVVLFFYLGFVFHQSGSQKVPTFVRVWWGLFLFVSCSFLVVDYVWYKGMGVMKTRLWVLDLGSCVFGVVVNLAAAFGMGSGEEEDKEEKKL